MVSSRRTSSWDHARSSARCFGAWRGCRSCSWGSRRSCSPFAPWRRGCTTSRRARSRPSSGRRCQAAIFLVVVVLAGGVREELQRAFILHRFDQRLGGARVGLVLFTIAFGAFHLDQGYDVALAICCPGLVLGSRLHPAPVRHPANGEPRQLQRHAGGPDHARQGSERLSACARSHPDAGLVHRGPRSRLSRCRSQPSRRGSTRRMRSSSLRGCDPPPSTATPTSTTNTGIFTTPARMRDEGFRTHVPRRDQRSRPPAQLHPDRHRHPVGAVLCARDMSPRSRQERRPTGSVSLTSPRSRTGPRCTVSSRSSSRTRSCGASLGDASVDSDARGVVRHAARVLHVRGARVLARLFGVRRVAVLWIWLRVRRDWTPAGAACLGASAALMAMVREQDLFFAAGPALDFRQMVVPRPTDRRHRPVRRDGRARGSTRVPSATCRVSGAERTSRARTRGGDGR